MQFPCAVYSAPPKESLHFERSLTSCRAYVVHLHFGRAAGPTLGLKPSWIFASFAFGAARRSNSASLAVGDVVSSAFGGAGGAGGRRAAGGRGGEIEGRRRNSNNPSLKGGENIEGLPCKCPWVLGAKVVSPHFGTQAHYFYILRIAA